MSEFVVKIDRAKCIGSQGCIQVDPKNWYLAADGKAKFKKALLKTDEEIRASKAAEAACPVNAILVSLKKK